MVRTDWPSSQVLPLKLIRVILDEGNRLYISVLDTISVSFEISVWAAARLWSRFSRNPSKKIPVPVTRVFVHGYMGVFFQYKHFMTAVEYLLVRRRSQTMTKDQQRLRWRQTCEAILHRVSIRASFPHKTPTVIGDPQEEKAERPPGILLAEETVATPVEIDSEISPEQFAWAMYKEKPQAMETEETEEPPGEWESQVVSQCERGRESRRNFVRELAEKYQVSLSEYASATREAFPVNVLVARKRKHA